MGRKRKSNPLDLPLRVYPKHGAFYYHHKDGRWQHLGTDVAVAKKLASDIINGLNADYGSVSYWLDRFLIASQKRVDAGDLSARTLADYTADTIKLKDYYGKMHPAGLEPKHKAAYLDLNLELGRPVRGNREFACLSAMMSWLARSGEAGVKSNPFIRSGVKRNKETPRDRYVEHDEMQKALKDAPVQVWALANLVYRTLQRPEDIITWTMRNITKRTTPDGREVKIIRNVQQKMIGRTDKVVDIEVGPEIEAILARLKGSKTKLQGLTLIHRQDGKPYTYDGLCSMLKRRQKTANVTSFGFYDLKGKGATDMWLSGIPLEQIQVLCGHESITTTEIYVKGRWRGVVQSNRVEMGKTA